MRFFVGVIALNLMICAAAFGKSWPSSGNFDVAEFESGCFLNATYEGRGETELSLMLGFDGDNFITVENALWSAEEDKIYSDIAFEFQMRSYTGGTVLGIKANFKSGFGAKASAAFLDDFSKSSYLHIMKDGETIDHLSLKGSALALQTARACLRDWKARVQAEQKKRQRLEDLSDDPFAKK